MALNDRRRSGPEKKTAWIEVRVSHEEKNRFLTACRAAGQTASDIIRDRMEQFVRRPNRRRLSMMINAGALAAFLVLLSIAPGTGVAPDAVAPEPNAPVVLTVQIVDEAGVPLEERVMGLAAPEQAAGLFDDVAILSETRSVTDHGLDIRMTVQAGSSGIVE